MRTGPVGYVHIMNHTQGYNGIKGQENEIDVSFQNVSEAKVNE